jgi:hypothetical protein
VISSFVCGIDHWRRAAALVLFALAVAASGCGSSEQTQSPGGTGTGPAGSLKQEDLYRYEGTGAAKKKVMISRKERVKLIREAREKAGSQ